MEGLKILNNFIANFIFLDISRRIDNPVGTQSLLRAYSDIRIFN